MKGQEIGDADIPLEIHIETDDEKKTFTIQVTITIYRVFWQSY